MCVIKDFHLFDMCISVVMSNSTCGFHTTNRINAVLHSKYFGLHSASTLLSLLSILLS